MLVLVLVLAVVLVWSTLLRERQRARAVEEIGSCECGQR